MLFALCLSSFRRRRYSIISSNFKMCLVIDLYLVSIITSTELSYFCVSSIQVTLLLIPLIPEFGLSAIYLYGMVSHVRLIL